MFENRLRLVIGNCQNKPLYIILNDRKFNVNNCKNILILLLILTSSVNLFVSKSDRHLNSLNSSSRLISKPVMGIY